MWRLRGQEARCARGTASGLLTDCDLLRGCLTPKTQHPALPRGRLKEQSPAGFREACVEDVHGGDGDICKPPRSVICATAIRELPGWAMVGHQHRAQDRQPHRWGLAPASLTLVWGRQTSRNRQMARSLWGVSPREQGLEQRVWGLWPLRRVHSHGAP